MACPMLMMVAALVSSGAEAAIVFRTLPFCQNEIVNKINAHGAADHQGAPE